MLPAAASGLVRAALIAAVALPLVASLAVAALPALDAQAWRSLFDEPGIARSLLLSVGIATASTALAWALTLLLITWVMQQGAAQRIQAWLGPLLAFPHAAFAIGMLWMLAPAGWLARLLALPLGWTAPPDWRAMQDSWGLSLAAVLVFKELPFLMWNGLALLRRPDVAQSVTRQTTLARSLGVGTARLWWTALWPQWAAQLRWPLLAVLAYGLSVVDVALIIGPNAPPTLAVWAWQALADADPARNAAGAAAAWLLAATLPVLAWALGGAGLALAAVARRLSTAGPSPPRRWTSMVGSAAAGTVASAVLLSYAFAGAALVFGALAGPWAFPALWPSSWHGNAWSAGAGDLARWGFTAALGAVVATACVAGAAAWLAATDVRWDRASGSLLMLPLLVPNLLWLSGWYPLALRAHLDATATGLVWTHALLTLPYTLFLLTGPWRSLDPRLMTVARLLGHGAWATLWRVRLPLLRAPLAAAWAVGFAVSVAQFLPTQFVGAGRLTTVTTEAVTLAAAGQRGPASAQALLQLLLPLLGFALAAWLSGPRRRERRGFAR